MVAKMMMKYGNEEDKKMAIAVLREFMSKGKENKEAPLQEASRLPEASPLPQTSPLQTTPIPFNYFSTPSTHQLGPGNGDDIGDDGLSHN